MRSGSAASWARQNSPSRRRFAAATLSLPRVSMDCMAPPVQKSKSNASAGGPGRADGARPSSPSGVSGRRAPRRAGPATRPGTSPPWGAGRGSWRTPAGRRTLPGESSTCRSRSKIVRWVASGRHRGRPPRKSTWCSPGVLHREERVEERVAAEVMLPPHRHQGVERMILMVAGSQRVPGHGLQIRAERQLGGRVRPQAQGVHEHPLNPVHPRQVPSGKGRPDRRVVTAAHLPEEGGVHGEDHLKRRHSLGAGQLPDRVTALRAERERQVVPLRPADRRPWQIDGQIETFDRPGERLGPEATLGLGQRAPLRPVRPLCEVPVTQLHLGSRLVPEQRRPLGHQEGERVTVGEEVVNVQHQPCPTVVPHQGRTHRGA